MYSQTTRDITVNVEPRFLEDQSTPADHHYVWSYTVQIRNGGARSVQLLRRLWRITDARGEVREIAGDGVVGEQPILAPGQHYQYTSGAPLRTPSGFMSGRYEMAAADGEAFDVAIPVFSLDSPYAPAGLGVGERPLYLN